MGTYCEDILPESGGFTLSGREHAGPWGTKLRKGGVEGYLAEDLRARASFVCSRIANRHHYGARPLSKLLRATQSYKGYGNPA